MKTNKKLVTIIVALGLTFGGGAVGFAAGLGFFDNATIVQNNIDKLVTIANGHKQKAADLQAKLDQNNGDQQQLKDQISQLKDQLAQKDQEKQVAIDTKQKEIDQKQRELDQKQQEADQLRQQIDQLKQESNNKDQAISQYEQEMQRLADYSNQKVSDVK